MARVRIEDQREFELTDRHHDLRGRELRDAVGRPLGTIKTMIVDTDARRVDAVVLETGTEYPVRDLQIMEQAVYYIPTPAADTGGAAASVGTAYAASLQPASVPPATVYGTTADPAAAAPAVPPPAPPAVPQGPADPVVPSPAPPLGGFVSPTSAYETGGPAGPTHSAMAGPSADAAGTVPPAAAYPAAPEPVVLSTPHNVAADAARHTEPSLSSPRADEPVPAAGYAPVPEYPAAPAYSGAPGAASGDSLGTERRRPADFAQEHDEDFRDHFLGLYDVPGLAYDDLTPAYRFGVEAAGEHRYLNHDGIADEEGLRDRFNARFGYPASDRLAWLGARAAVLHGLGRASRTV